MPKRTKRTTPSYVPVRKDWDTFVAEQRQIYLENKERSWFDSDTFIFKMQSLLKSKEQYDSDGTLPENDWERDMLRMYYIQDIPKI